MTAALIAHTDVGFPISNNAASAGTGLVEGTYSVTIVTTLDWVVLEDFSEVKYVHAYTTANGADAEAYVDGTTKNKVFITGTGATTLKVMGTPA